MTNHEYILQRAREGDRLIDVSVAARKMGVDSRTLRRWIAAGALPAVKQENGRYRIYSSEAHLLTVEEHDRKCAAAAVPPAAVYFVRSAPYIKIGYTMDVPARINALISINPHPCELLAVLRFESPSRARAYEAELHARFSAHRHHHEWFKESDEITNFIASLQESE